MIIIIIVIVRVTLTLILIAILIILINIFKIKPLLQKRIFHICNAVSVNFKCYDYHWTWWFYVIVSYD